MDEIDKKLLTVMRKGIPLVEEPFLEIAKKVGISRDEMITRLKRLMDSGVVKRFGVSINHKKIGITANAVVAWKVPRRRIEEIGRLLANHQDITHCYERKTIPDKWEYNLYTVVHGHNRESVRQFIKELSQSTGLEDHSILFSSRRFKRSSVSPQITRKEGAN